MKLPIPFSITRNKSETAYFEHRQLNRFLNVLGVGIKQVAEDHARTIAEANRAAGKEISQTLKKGFDQVEEGQQAIHHALVDQTEVIFEGFQAVEHQLETGFEQTTRGLQEVAGRIDNVGEVVIETGEKLFHGLAGLKAAVDMGMMNIVSQFELQRTEIQQGFDLLADLLENNRKTEARERYRDGLEAYEKYLQHPDEPQFLKDARDYMLQSVEIYRGNPFCHLYLGHIYQEAAGLYDLDRSLEHFKLCATYAKGIPNASLTAVGYFLAAWTAYVKHDLDQAISLGKQSLEYNPSGIPENYYNLAKYHACKDLSQEALNFLDHAIKKFDPYYALKANLDSDFEGMKAELEAYFVQIREEEAETWKRRIQQLGLKAPNE